MSTYTNHRNETVTVLRNGSRLAEITAETSGAYYVALHIDHGQGERTFCDSATYKTERGAMRKARGFVK